MEEVGLTFYMRQAPSAVFSIVRRRFRFFSEHYFQICIELVEELFEIQVIHQK